MKRSTLWCLTALSATIVGCSSGDSNLDASEAVVERIPVSSSVNVFDDQIAISRTAPTALAGNTVNFLDHPGFEDGLGGWTGCSSDAISISSDSLDGDSALKIGPGNCAYQTISAIPNQTFHLSCYVKLTDDTAWTGMGMDAANGNYRRQLSAPSVTVTSSDYAQVATSITVPSNSTFLSVWLHSDHGAIVDSCSLTLNDNAEPVPIAFANNDLLLNGNFNQVNDNTRATNWATGCNGQAIANRNTLSVLNGACVDQTLSSDRIDTLAMATSILSCQIEDVSGYADMGVYLNDEPVKVRRIKSRHIGTRLSLNVPAASGRNGFVSLYADESLEVSNCTYIVNAADSPEGDEINDVIGIDDIEQIPSGNPVPVEFASNDLQELVRSILNIDSNHVINSHDMLELKLLRDVKGKGENINSLVGLEYAKNLERMVIGRFKVSDLGPLSELTKIHTLFINSDNLEDISALASLSNLNTLTLQPSPRLTDLSALSGLTNLKTLRIYGGEDLIISDLTPLSGLDNLVFLALYGASVADVAPIASLPKLEKLFTGGVVENIPALAAGSSLVFGDLFALEVQSNDLSAFSPNLTALHALNDRGVSVYLSGADRVKIELPELSIGL